MRLNKNLDRTKALPARLFEQTTTWTTGETHPMLVDESNALKCKQMGIYVTQVTPTACGFRPLGLERI
jgi:hypothetical protein